MSKVLLAPGRCLMWGCGKPTDGGACPSCREHLDAPPRPDLFSREWERARARERWHDRKEAEEAGYFDRLRANSERQRRYRDSHRNGEAPPER